MKFELGPMQEKWMAAAESGEYKQTSGHLRYDGAFCFLGLAIQACGLRESGRFSLHSSYSKLGLRSSTGRFSRRRVVKQGVRAAYSIFEANDCLGATFTEIAAFIRANPEVVFKEAK